MIGGRRGAVARGARPRAVAVPGPSRVPREPLPRPGSRGPLAVSPDPPPYAYDLFVSYAHADDPGTPPPRVSALVEAIQAGYLEVAGKPLNVFFDTREARAMDDWEARILAGLRQSKMMVAILSPAYFASAYCRKEWEA